MIFGRRKKSKEAEASAPATIQEALRKEDTAAASAGGGGTAVSAEAPTERSAGSAAPRTTTDAAPKDDVAASSETTEEESAPSTAGDGPYDISEIESTKGYIDFGAVLVPAGKDQKVRLDIDQKTKRVVALTISVGQASIQIQPFSAPKSGGTWDEVREQIQDSVIKQKGRIKELDGRFGKEIAARVPTTLKDGRSGWRVARFVGFEGNRWFLRGVVGGRGAIDPKAARGVEDLFSRLVVVRGDDPLPPRELLALRPPEGAKRVVTPRNPAQRRDAAPGPNPAAAAVGDSDEAQPTDNGVRPQEKNGTARRQARTDGPGQV
ncbi:DUF3710 domain-containing protein [Nesterenkonia suensis]